MKNEIEINGDVYVKKNDSGGQRCLVVVDRGWIYAGDVYDEMHAVAGHRIKIRNALWVFHWDRIGLDGVLKNPNHDDVTIKKLPDGASTVDMPGDAEVYRIPVPDGWGV